MLIYTRIGLVTLGLVVLVMLTPSIGFAADPTMVATPIGVATTSSDGGRAFNVIANLALRIYGWLKIPAMSVALFVAGFGIFRWLLQGASNPQAHRRGIETVIAVVVLLFLMMTLDGILNLVVNVGNDVSQYLKENVTPLPTLIVK
jgi:hypothetical protein